jgi:hypothetical protein
MAVVEDVQARFTGGSSSPVGDYPASIGSTNEYLVMAVVINSDSVTVDSGAGAWTLLQDLNDGGTNLRIYVYGKTAASESGTITLTLSGSAGTWIGIARISGTSGVDTSAKSTEDFLGTTHDAPSITMTNAGQRWLCVLGCRGGDGTADGAAPSGSSLSAGESAVSQNFFTEMYFADRTFAGSGPTGTQQWTSLPSTEYRGAVAIGFLDSGGGGGGVVVPGIAQRNRRHTGRFM